MPSTLAQLTGAEVVHHTRGGARLSEQLNKSTQMGAKTLAALRDEKWDYVVLQEMSNGPITSKQSYLKSVASLCKIIRENGAQPILYATWAYQKAGEQLKKFGMDYDEMYQQMHSAFTEAAELNHCLIADVGTLFYQLSDTQNLYAEDGSHPNKAGSKLIAETITNVILGNQKSAAKVEIVQEAESDNRLRLLYLYHLLLSQSDEDHPLTTKQIQEKMEELHHITMHRTTVPSDIALLKAAGFEIIGERKRAWNYYLVDRTFSLPELKVLIDAVQSSKFITAKKSAVLIEKLISLTSETNADKLKRSIHISGRSKSDNEKGYYIVDAINDAMNAGRKISFLYFELDGKKKPVLKNAGKPYTVSPFDLIWDGDFYYLTGYCDERASVRVFRVDRIEHQPDVLDELAVPKPDDYDVDKYTSEVFRMFVTDEAVDVTLICDNDAMKFVVDKFGMDIKSKSVGTDQFRATVKVCPSPTFYRWIFGLNGKIKIEGPDEVKEEYRNMLLRAVENI